MGPVNLGRRAALALVPGFGAIAQAQAQTWPSGNLRLMVPFGPGGSTDIMGRLLATGLQKRLGVPVLVENRGGAATSPTPSSARPRRRRPCSSISARGARSGASHTT